MRNGYYIQMSVPITDDDFQFAIDQYQNVVGQHNIAELLAKKYTVNMPSMYGCTPPEVSFTLQEGPENGNFSETFDHWYGLDVTIEQYDLTYESKKVAHLKTYDMEWLYVLYVKRKRGAQMRLENVFRKDKKKCSFCNFFLF